MNYSQLERFSRAVLRHELNFEIEGECEGWTTLCIMQNDSPDSHHWYGTSLTIIFCLQWYSIIGIWCWLAITLHAKIKAHLRIITIKISKISCEKLILLSRDIIFQTFTCVFFVLLHTFVQKPLHKPDLHISNSVTTRNDLDMFLQGIASNASCPNGNLDPMRVVVGNLRILGTEGWPILQGWSSVSFRKCN